MFLSLISWNIRGLGKKEKRCAVRRLLADKKPRILFLQETKMENFTPVILRNMGCRQNFEKAFSPSIGSAGGLISIWDPEFFEASDRFIFP
ncbi:hypothetical protein HRI_003171200 [Hibiscus trionum]|uniref:Uncharacterized protein n=1 Tax=Hibiscus trionum TaxID=183268 RepID=A0A9W7IFB4_HIBTR|nr:hypothetical protein HRI_003171200 [Hibiscus trionum]